MVLERARRAAMRCGGFCYVNNLWKPTQRFIIWYPAELLAISIRFQSYFGIRVER